MALQTIVVSTMLKGAARRYPFVFVHLVFSILLTVTQVSFGQYFGVKSSQYMRAYWAGDFVGTFLVLMIIIHLIRTAMENHVHRNAVYFGLLLGVAATAGGVLILRGSRFNLGRWMTEASRDYYFAAVLLNAVLWCVLMRTGRLNRQLFLLTSGLGLKLTGAAIAHALRLTGVILLAHQFLMLTYMLHLFVWYVALKRLPCAIPAEERIKQVSPV